MAEQERAPSDHDETHRRLMELFQQKGFRLIFEEAPFAIALKDRHNLLVRANPYVQRLSGKASEDAEGHRMEDLFPGEAAYFFAQDQEVLRTGKPLCDLVQRYETPSGALLWTLADKMPFRDDDGQVVGVLVFERDITEAKQAERVAIAEARDARRAERERVKLEEQTRIAAEAAEREAAIEAAARAEADERDAANKARIARVFEDEAARKAERDRRYAARKARKTG